MSTSTDAASEASPVFRAAKRRKVVQRRTRDTSTDGHDDDKSDNAMIPESDEATDDRVHVDGETTSEERPRLAVPPRQRKGGITYAAQRPSQSTAVALAQSTASQGTTSEDSQMTALQLAASRFAPQTGRVQEGLNKHMTAFVDSELARARQSYTTIVASASTTNPRSQIPDKSEDPFTQHQPAALGMLQEVDLGPAATQRNKERTEAAARLLHDPSTFPPDLVAQSAPHPPSSKVTQQSARPRKGRPRRTSADIARDAAVDALLRETRIDMYDAPSTAVHSDGTVHANANAQANATVNADDALAEAFQQEYRDAQEARANRRPATTATTAQGGRGGGGVKNAVADSLAKGPKLGGSRSARAAMHRALEEKMGVARRR